LITEVTPFLELQQKDILPISLSAISKFFGFYSITRNEPMRLKCNFILGLLLSNNIVFRLARPKTKASFKPAGPPPIMAQSNNISIWLSVDL